jgi:hypothetical protein
LLCLQIVPARALLHSNLTDTLVHSRCLHNLGPFFDSQREWLLDVDVLARVERIDGDRRMPVIRHCNDHGVDVLRIEDVPVILEGLAGGRGLAGHLHRRGVDVAQRADLDAAKLQEIVHVADAARAASNQSETDAVVRAADARIRQSGSRGGGAGGLDEIPAIDGHG